MPEIAIILLVSLLITTFIRPAWLNWAVSTAGLIFIFSAAVISSGLHDLTPMYLWAGAWLWGELGGILLRFMWAGHAQVTFQAPNQWPWLNWLLSAFWLAFAAGSVGYAFASNIDISYAKSREATWILYDRSMMGAASGFFFLSLAAINAITAFVKPALTNKGLRSGIVTTVEWKEIDSYEWQGNKLIIHRKIKFFSRWLSHSWFVTKPADLEIVNRILAQHLSNAQVQPSASVQTAA